MSLSLKLFPSYYLKVSKFMSTSFYFFLKKNHVICTILSSRDREKTTRFLRFFLCCKKRNLIKLFAFFICNGWVDGHLSYYFRFGRRILNVNSKYAEKIWRSQEMEINNEYMESIWHNNAFDVISNGFTTI